MKSLIAAALFLGIFQDAPAGDNGSISGIVIQAGTDQPIDAVQIIMTPVNTQGGGRGLNTIQTYTDLRGRFNLTDIKPGRYRMKWQRSGFSTPPVGTPAPEKSVVESVKAQLEVEKIQSPTPLSSASILVDVAPQQRITGFVFFLTAGVLGVHSLDRFVFTVPELGEAERFYSTFGLDVRRSGQRLDLHTVRPETFEHPRINLRERKIKCHILRESQIPSLSFLNNGTRSQSGSQPAYGVRNPKCYIRSFT
jgi:hypothetical protein